MKINAFYGFLALFLLPAVCHAEQDFYGIQMKNELWAENLVLNEGVSADPADLAQGPVLDHTVHAEASLKPVTDERIDFQVNVINDSSAPIVSDYRYRDFFIYTTSGRKFPLIDTQEDSRLDAIAPRSSATFSPSSGNLKIRNDEVRMIGCSFDLGKTQVFLFPWSQKERINHLVSPAAPPVPVAPPKVSHKWTAFHSPDKKQSAKPPKPAIKKTVAAPAPGEPLMTPMAMPVRSTSAGPAPVPAPLPSASPAPVPASSPETRARLDAAIKNFVYTPSVGKTGEKVEPAAPAARTAVEPIPATVPFRDEAHVLDYNKAYNFITLNMGKKDGLRQNMTVTILRDGKTVAKAKVQQLREAVSAATLVSGTIRGEIRPGDKISLV